MHDVFAESVQLVFHNDGNTPVEFVRELLRGVFGLRQREAIAFSSLIDDRGKAACGPYPFPVAKALLEAAQRRIHTAGHRLAITSEGVKTNGPCDLCGSLVAVRQVPLKRKAACLCPSCVLAVLDASEELEAEEFGYACVALDWHFAGISRNRLVTAARQFPGHMRPDVQAAVDKMVASSTHFFGLHEEYRYETVTFAALMKDGRNAVVIAPPQYHDVDIGEPVPVRCLHNGLWLCKADELRYAVLLTFHREHNNAPMLRIEIAVPAGAAGQTFTQRTFAELEQAVHAARSYRGKILSLDGDADYRGRSRGIMVHRLPPVDRDQVILPERTLKLLDRNILDFVGSRGALREFGQSTRKGVLLYGPPGTGKTHTIRYLATNLPGHTTLIITAEQVALLGTYMNLARLLQPTMVVIQDVDLIASDRDDMGPCEESLLNDLLNEMDGLKEDADILFVLTTNRPEQLESALAGRPGRIDQAIEVPLPDEIGRGKLVRLYGKNLPLEDTVADEAVRRTAGVSAAFIKELMRRLAQASVARNGGTSVTSADLDEAIDDMLFTGGRLNARLLGGAQEMVAG
jgi:ATP-dependent Clp protease adapter protein ClpS